MDGRYPKLLATAGWLWADMRHEKAVNLRALDEVASGVDVTDPRHLQK